MRVAFTEKGLVASASPKTAPNTFAPFFEIAARKWDVSGGGCAAHRHSGKDTLQNKVSGEVWFFAVAKPGGEVRTKLAVKFFGTMWRLVPQRLESPGACTIHHG